MTRTSSVNGGKRDELITRYTRVRVRNVRIDGSVNIENGQLVWTRNVMVAVYNLYNINRYVTVARTDTRAVRFLRKRSSYWHA